MLVLTLAAAAAEPVGHVGVSIGQQFVPGATADRGDVARVELGAGTEKALGCLVVQASLQNAPVAVATEAPAVYGDFAMIEAGPGARLPLSWGRFHLAPHAELGLSALHSPLSDEAAHELDEELEAPPTAGAHARGPWVQAGVEVGGEVGEAIALFGALDGGYRGFSGAGVFVQVRLGASARF